MVLLTWPSGFLQIKLDAWNGWTGDSFLTDHITHLLLYAKVNTYAVTNAWIAGEAFTDIQIIRK